MLAIQASADGSRLVVLEKQPSGFWLAVSPDRWSVISRATANERRPLVPVVLAEFDDMDTAKEVSTETKTPSLASVPTAEFLKSFLDHFHSLPQIDPQRTNMPLVCALCDMYLMAESKSRVCHAFHTSRNTGVTSTVLAFARYVSSPVTILSCDHAKLKLLDGINAISWFRARNKNLADHFVIVDQPMYPVDRRSRDTMDKYHNTLRNLRCRGLFEIIQPSGDLPDL